MGVLPVTPAIAAPRPAQPINPLAQIGSGLLLVFLFLVYSRILDFNFGRLHIPLLVSSLAFFACTITGGLQRALRTRVGLLLLAFTGWLIAAIPFSVWKGGSVTTVEGAWLKSFLVYILAAALIVTIQQCRRAMYTIAVAALVVSFLCFYYRSTVHGRFALPSGALENPNDLAQVLLMAFPFWLLMGMNGARVPFRRATVAVCVIPILIVTVATGSRGAMLSMAVMSVVTFFSVSAANKLKLILGVFTLTLGAVALSPRVALDRYRSLFDRENVATIEDLTAAESMSQRLFLLKQSIRITIRHPLFGVGPGNFETASADDAHKEGLRAPGRGTHNAYTQISSEAGIPALLLYAAAMLHCLRLNLRIRREARGRPELAEISNMAFCLMLSIISLAVSSFFATIAYEFFFPTLAGLTIAFVRAASPEVTALGNKSAPTASPAYRPQG